MFLSKIHSTIFASTCFRISMVGGIMLLSIWLRAGYLPAGVWGGHDDALFLKLARNLGQGRWLGPYDQLTMAKGPFFPVFLLFGKASGLPLKLVEHIFYVLFAMMAAVTTYRLTGRRWLSAAVTVALLLSPVPWMFEGGSRITREPLYQVMTFAILLVSTRYFLLGDSKPSTGLALGVLGGSYWLTREEGAWLLPALAILVLPCMFRIGRSVVRKAWMTVTGDLRIIALPVVGFVVIVMAVNTINLLVYGVFRNNDLRSGPFLEAYGALARIKHDTFRRYVIFPKEARSLAYSVSPAARELEPYLDGRNGIQWAKASQHYPAPWGCADRPQACNEEILSAWFVWALRDAVSAAGHYRSAAIADAYFRRLASEINSACESGAIPCDQRLYGLTPKWRGHYFNDGLAASMDVLGTLIRLSQGHVGVPPSVLSTEQADIFRYAVNSPISGDSGRGILGAGPLHDTRIALTRIVGKLYAFGSMPLFVLAMMGYLITLYSCRAKESSFPHSRELALMLSALLVATFSRVGLLGFLEATAIPSNNMLYLLPTISIYLLFIVLSSGAGLCEAARAVRKWRHRLP